MVSCHICGRSGEAPATIADAGPTPWGLLQITELWKAGDSEAEPQTKMIVCSKTCAIVAITQSELRDVERGGEAA